MSWFWVQSRSQLSQESGLQCRYYEGLIPDSIPNPLPPHEHLRQLQLVYGPLSPAFVAEELDCTLGEAARHLYGAHATEYAWVSLTDLAHLSTVSLMGLKRWVRRHHLQSAQRQDQGRTASLCIHLDDARHFLQSTPGTEDVVVDALPRVSAADLCPPAPQAAGVDMDWHLARQAAWPMTLTRLAEAVYGSRSAQTQQQTQKLIRRWEAEGRIVCFARGLYDLVRPSLVLNPERYGRSVLPKAELQKLRNHHPEIAHWSARSLAAAWRAYSRFYAGRLLPVADRGEPTFLEHLMVCQLNPVEMPGEVNTRYEELCQEAAFYRLVPAPSQHAVEMEQPELSVENIEAGLIDFKAVADATRLKMQRNSGRGQGPGMSRRPAASRAKAGVNP